jgi:hypothetical protein
VNFELEDFGAAISRKRHNGRGRTASIPTGAAAQLARLNPGPHHSRGFAKRIHHHIGVFFSTTKRFLKWEKVRWKAEALLTQKMSESESHDNESIVGRTDTLHKFEK